MFSDLINKNKKIAVVGLGYVGLPLAKLLSSKYDVIGFDISEFKIESYKNGIDMIEGDDLNDFDIHFTSDEKELSNANFFIVTVPTPIKEDNEPDLSFIRSSTETVARNMPKNSIVVYESTVYPGVTEDVCIPILEEGSGFKCGEDFKVGYSPERVNPGKNNQKIEDITKIVSGMDEESLDIIANVYDSVLNNGIFRAKSIKIAEAAKITENIQRDVNIALVNELAKIYNSMGININDVIEAAGTKWNFVKYQPGLVGGHCIGIDPYYLIYQSDKLNCDTDLMKTSRKINESMIDYVHDNIVNTLAENNIDINEADILVCGVTFKENCNDIRNSKIIEIIKKLEESGANIELNDPNAIPEELERIHNLTLSDEFNNKFDAIVIGVAHSEYQNLAVNDLENISKNNIILFDLKETVREEFDNKDNIVYWSL
ncbi:hypothetical protein TL18_08595 [Methanobrevibacter sp. YE315]|uniref:nucleotide sugar dehydrogenase n=1 Tax=Methanobrevibacter sp. YE315 TaxID=1609968 RepID=UPI000764DF68|nr:nucleotide sugar dehydrogenase [Methanobrevibacter sp. YE315]AMD18071.1 hypothetical protein TL18_08595 [Methanobrevibacter sp. YE315]